MMFKSLLAGFALLAALGGCATYDDGYARGYRGDGRYDGHHGDRYYDGWQRRYGDRDSYYYGSH